ncbi:MAG: hypothetical protein U0M60_07175 [Clostridia bacterium]|nr:hypothetical protein [Clostridia bacterium]
MSDLIRKDEICKALALWDWQDLYLPVHFKKLVDECPTVGGGYTEQNVRDAYTDGYSDGIQKGYENALRNYRHLILRLWRPASEKPDKSGQYLCTLWDKDGVFLALTEWNETFGGRWQAVFEGEDSYSDIGNVLAWMPLPGPYTESKGEDG